MSVSSVEPFAAVNPRAAGAHGGQPARGRQRRRGRCRARGVYRQTKAPGPADPVGSASRPARRSARDERVGAADRLIGGCPVRRAGVDGQRKDVRSLDGRGRGRRCGPVAVVRTRRDLEEGRRSTLRRARTCRRCVRGTCAQQHCDDAEQRGQERERATQASSGGVLRHRPAPSWLLYTGNRHCQVSREQYTTDVARPRYRVIRCSC